MAIVVFAPSTAGVLRQCEIVSGFTQLQLDIPRLRDGVVELTPINHPHVIVLSQDCDLEQDFKRRENGDEEHLLDSILFCAAAPADDEFRHGVGLNSNEWKKLRQNNDPRFHFIRSVTTELDADGQGLPELVVDFKTYFAVPTLEAYYSIESSVRRCRLLSPYLEHLSTRFAAYLSRVGLPLDHHLPMPADPAPPQAGAGADAAVVPVEVQQEVAGAHAGAEVPADEPQQQQVAAALPAAAPAGAPALIAQVPHAEDDKA